MLSVVMLIVVMLIVVMLNVVMQYHYAESRDLFIVTLSVNGECHYAECRGALCTAWNSIIPEIVKLHLGFKND